MEPTTTPAPGIDPSYRDARAALDSIRQWKNFFLSITFLCLALHIGGWAASEYYGIYPGRLDAEGRLIDTDDGAAPGALTTRPSRADPATVERIRNVIETSLPLTEFIGRAAAFLLCVTVLLAVLVALCGRLPTAGFVQSFFWSLIVAAMLMPWERLTAQGAVLPGVFITPATLQTPVQTELLEGVDQFMPYVRFVAYPLLTLILLAFAGSRFSRSIREADRRPGAQIPMRVV